MHSLIERPWHRASVESQLRLRSLLMVVTTKEEEDDETKKAMVKMRIDKAGGEEELPMVCLHFFLITLVNSTSTKGKRFLSFKMF